MARSTIMLKDAVDTYLAVRRAGGFKLQDDELYLNSFVRFATARGDTHIVTKTAIAWARQARSEPQRATRLKTIIRFARFSRATDCRHELPPHGVFNPQRQRPVPYLFSEQEIGLLAATGLRISEALGLCFQDITPDGLVIRETKFRKSRLVALHPTTRAALEAYLVKRTQLATDDEHLFVSLRRRRLSRTVVYPTFRQLFTAAGLPRTPDRSQPRLIDFRHTFASNVLLTSPDRRDHIGRHMLALSTYLGHAHVSCTYWYFESTPQLMDDISQACERFIEENTP